MQSLHCTHSNYRRSSVLTTILSSTKPVYWGAQPQASLHAHSSLPASFPKESHDCLHQSHRHLLQSLTMSVQPAISARAVLPSRDRTVEQPTSSNPRLLRIAPLPLIRIARTALASFRLHPIFTTPRATFSRWRSHRALKAAARAARNPRQERDWHSRFRLHGLTWHHNYIAQDLHRIHLFLNELQALRHPTIPVVSPRTAARAISNSSPEHMQSVLSDATAVALLVRIERAYSYLLDNVCDVYNSLEKHILFPWLLTGVPASSPLHRALALFSKERDRIEDDADRIQARFARVVCATGFAYASTGSCSSSRTFSATRARRLKRRREAADARARADALRYGGGDTSAANGENVGEKEEVTGAGGSTVSADEVERRRRSSIALRDGFRPPLPPEGTVIVSARSRRLRATPSDDVRQLAADIATLVEDTERLHRTERSLLYPLIASSFNDKEQWRLTNVLVYSMRSAMAKFIITIYHQSVEKQASRAEWKWYKREVPLPIRVYTPVWRARLYDRSPLGWLRQTPVRSLRSTDMEDL